MIPIDYAQWRELLDEIQSSARNDDYIKVIKSGRFEWISGVSDRFVQSVYNMIAHRVNAAHTAYQNQIKHNNIGDAGIARALTLLSQEYRYLYRIVSALPMPETEMIRLLNIIQKQADDTQNNLVASAKTDRTGKLSAHVRRAPVNLLRDRS